MTRRNFDILQVRERLNENLSSDQIANSLDEMIFNSIEPLLFGTMHVEQSLAEMLPFTASNARRKFSNMPPAEFVDSLFSVIVGKKKEPKFKLLRRMRIERTVHFNYINSFKRLAALHAQAEAAYLSTPRKNKATRFLALQEMRRIEHQVGLCPGHNMQQINAKLSYWLDQAMEFRGMVAEKFIRLAYTDSLKAHGQTGLNISHDDLFNDFMVAIFKGIDKYDPEKGALTSYIRWWFMDAKTPFRNGHEYGVAFHMPTSQRKKMLENGTMRVSNLAATMDTEGAQEVADTGLDLLHKLINEEDSERGIRIAVQADPHGLACLLSEVSYALSEEEIQALKSTNLQSGRSDSASA